MKFTILTAIHNSYNFLDDCAKSILGQDYPKLEWIVIDDASDDESYKFFDQLNDSRVKYFKNSKRLFCSSSYNIALSHATGDICGVVDGDDVLAKNAISKIVTVYKNHPQLSYIYTQHHWCDKHLRPIKGGVSCCPKQGVSILDMSLKHKRHCFSHWRTFKTNLRKKAELFPHGLKYAVDKNLGFTLEECGWGGFLDRKLYYYRYHKANMSLKTGRDQKKAWRQLCNEYQGKRKKKSIRIYPVMKIK